MKITIEYNGVTTVKTISDIEMKAWLDRVDPVDWLVKAIDGQTHHNMKNLARKEQARLQADPAVTSGPMTMEGLVESAVAAPGYQDKAARDAARAAADA